MGWPGSGEDLGDIVEVGFFLLLPDPDIPEPCDLLVMESTYGDRNYRIERLGEVLNNALADGGKVFVQAFSLGRIHEYAI